MTSKLVFIAAFIFVCQFSFASEYEERARESYQESQQRGAASMLQSFATSGLKFRNFILAFARKHRGLADQGQCKIGTNYSCDGSLCTPGSTELMPVMSLGTIQGADFGCDVTLGDGLACHIDYGNSYGRVKADISADCFDSARRETVLKVR